MSQHPHPESDQWRPGFRNYLKRFFRNETANKAIANPFSISGGIFQEGDHLRRKEKKVGFLELFYDLFFVAALSVFSRESNLGTGSEIADYIVFVTILFSVWNSFTWLYSFLNLLVYGYIAASSGHFSVTYGLFPDTQNSQEQQAALEDTPQYVERVGVPEAENGDPTRVSLQGVSAVYAISRVILLAQYMRVYIMARRAKKNPQAIVYTISGLAISACCFCGALGVSGLPTTRAKAIARLSLWIVGLLTEFVTLVMSSASSRAIFYELDYWAERFAAVVLIILGEGLIGLFETFTSVYSGPTLGFRLSTIGQIFAAVAVQRIIYAQYFSSAHSPHFHRGPVLQLCWGLLHYPFILSLLLLLRCITNSISSTNVIIASRTYTSLIEGLQADTVGLSTSGVTVEQYVAIIRNKTEYPEIAAFAESLGVDLNRRLQTFVAEAGGDINIFLKLYSGSIYSVLARIFANYGYQPSEESYNFVDTALSASESPDYTAIFLEDVTILIAPVYTSVCFGFTVLGGYLLCLTALVWLEDKPKGLDFKIMYGYRLGLGIVMLLLSMLNIGHEVKAENLLGRGTPIAPIYRLVASSNFTAIIFLILFSVSLLDLVVYVCRTYQEDQKTKGIPQASESSTLSRRDSEDLCLQSPAEQVEEGDGPIGMVEKSAQHSVVQA